ncbi:MAG: hypothetical protein JWL60_730 [Gemmatimonadetes bacterium]|jgi:hypothetical protein|nr:hypothetical protein [Gemmatimonadota bacterium]
MRRVPTPALPLALPLALLLALPRSGARAQALNAHATVASSVSITRVADLAFGAVAITPGILATVTPANGGRARIDYNEPATVTAPAFVMLAGPSATQLRVDLQCAAHATSASSAPVLFPAGCAGGFSAPISGNVGGTHYVYVGGTVAAAASSAAPAGSYAGSFSVTATYVVY